MKISDEAMKDAQVSLGECAPFVAIVQGNVMLYPQRSKRQEAGVVSPKQITVSCS